MLPLILELFKDNGYTVVPIPKIVTLQRETLVGSATRICQRGRLRPLTNFWEIC